MEQGFHLDFFVHSFQLFFQNDTPVNILTRKYFFKKRKLVLPHVLRSNATFVVNTRGRRRGRRRRRRRRRRGPRHESLMRTPPPQLGKNVGKTAFFLLHLSKISWLRRSCEPARRNILLFHSLESSEKNLRPLLLSPSKEKMSCPQKQQGAKFCNEVSVSPAIDALGAFSSLSLTQFLRPAYGKSGEGPNKTNLSILPVYTVRRFSQLAALD